MRKIRSPRNRKPDKEISHAYPTSACTPRPQQADNATPETAAQSSPLAESHVERVFKEGLGRGESLHRGQRDMLRRATGTSASRQKSGLGHETCDKVAKDWPGCGYISQFLISAQRVESPYAGDLTGMSVY